MTDRVSHIWGEFIDESDARRFWASRRASMIQHLRTSVALGSILFAVAGAGDFVMWEFSLTLALGLVFRGLPLLWGAVVITRLTVEGLTWRRASGWVTSWVLLISGSLLGNIWLTQRVMLSHVLGLVAFILSIWLFFPIKARCNAFSSAALTVAGLLVLYDVGLTAPNDLLDVTIVLGGVGLLSALQARRVATLDRQGFLNEEELIRLATTDALTVVLNRRSVVARGDALLAEGVAASVALFDLDHFKLINDTHGHPAGDEVLRTFTRLCMAHLDPERTTFGRLGGEEFMVLMRGEELDEAREIIDDLRRRVDEQRLVFQGRSIRFTVSAGITTLESGDATVGDAMRRADLALYRAKSQGRNQVVTALAEAVEFDELSSASRRRSQWLVGERS